MNARKLLLAGLGCAVVTPALTAPGGTTLYKYDGASITDLGVLGNDVSSTAYDINNAGQIVGASKNSAGVARAFMYNVFYMLTINVGIGVTRSEAKGINNSGEVVGNFNGGSDTSFPRPFYWKASLPEIDRINNRPYASAYPNVMWGTSANAINDSGVIVGDSYVLWNTVTEPFPDLEGDCYSHIPVTWNSFNANPTMIFCPAYISNGGIAKAFDVNNTGQVAGMDRGSSAYGLFRIQIGAAFETSVPFPATPSSNNPGSHTADAYGINNNGAVAGYISYGAVKRALYWNGNTNWSVDLGVLASGTNSMAREVNDQGFVTGYSEYKTNPNSQTMRKAAFIWHANFGMKKLPAPESADGETANCEAFALNNRVESTGAIQAVGHCFIDGKWRATRWNISIGKYLN